MTNTLERIHRENPDYGIRSDGVITSYKLGKPRSLKPGVDRDGYLFVNLCQDGRQQTCRVHGLVAEAFFGLRPEGLVVMHRDNDPGNNHVDNLRYGTHGDNARQAIDDGRRSRTSRYRFVRWYRRDRKWRTQVWHNGKQKQLGSFACEDKAALAVNDYITLHGLDIPLNVIAVPCFV